MAEIVMFIVVMWVLMFIRGLVKLFNKYVCIKKD